MSIITSPNLNALSDRAERVFWRLVVQADDHGCLECDPEFVSKACCTRLKEVTEQIAETCLTELETHGLLRRWTCNSHVYGKLLTWNKHQRIRNAIRKTPEPPADFDNLPQLAATRRNSPQPAAGCGPIQNPESGIQNPESEHISVSSEPELTRIVEFWNLSEAGVRCRDANATVVAALRRKVKAHGYARVLEAIDTYRIVRTARAEDVHGVEQKLCPLGAGSYRWSLLQFCQRGNVEEDFFAGDRETAIRNRIGKGFPTGTVARFAVPFVVPPEFALPGGGE
jgi:hypothetical protein